MYQIYMRKLININKFTWGKVKQFATIQECSLGVAIDLLLSHALNSIDIIERKVVPIQKKASSNKFDKNNIPNDSDSFSSSRHHFEITNGKKVKNSNDLLTKSFRGSNQQA